VVSHSGVRGIGHLTSRSTIQLVNGVEGYTLIDTPNTVAGVPTGVSLWGTSVVDVNGGESWGVNTVSTDNKGQTISSGTGRQLYGYEADFNVTSPNTNVLGMVVQGASLSQLHISNGYSCGPLSFAHSEGLWGSCFISDDSVTDVGLAIGLSNTGITGAYPPAPAANTGSQLIEMGYSLSGTRYTAAIQASYEVGDGGGLGAIMVNNTNAAVPTNVGVNQGFFFTQDQSSTIATATGGKGVIIGAQNTSGANTPSQLIVESYYDASGTRQNYYQDVDSSGRYHLSGTASTGVTYFDGLTQLKSYKVSALPTCNAGLANALLP